MRKTPLKKALKTLTSHDLNDYTYLYKKSENKNILPEISAAISVDAPIEKAKKGGN